MVEKAKRNGGAHQYMACSYPLTICLCALVLAVCICTVRRCGLVFNGLGGRDGACVGVVYVYMYVKIKNVFKKCMHTGSEKAMRK